MSGGFLVDRACYSTQAVCQRRAFYSYTNKFIIMNSNEQYFSFDKNRSNESIFHAVFYVKEKGKKEKELWNCSSI